MSNEPTISTAKVTEEDTNGFTGFTQEQFLVIVNEPTIPTAKVTGEEDTNGFTGFTQEQFLIIVKAAQDRENGN